MLKAGYYQSLKVNRVSDFGLYLIDDEENEVLLPNRYVSLSDQVGDEIEVFIYHDSENRLIATRDKPFATAEQVAYLEVVDKNVHGLFLNWGITAKDLFIPNSNQPYRFDVGNKYVVYLYTDNITGRVVATARLNSYINNKEISVKLKEEVEVLVALRLNLGYRVIINNRHWGMIYDNQIFTPISLGDKLKGFVRKITADNRIDISLQKEGFDEVKDAVEQLKAIINSNGGQLHLCDKSSPEEVRAVTGMSKKVFKRALGFLLSHKEVKVENNSIMFLS